MLDKEVNQSEHSCCEIPLNGEASICKECGNKGKPVKDVTLKSLVMKPQIEVIKSLDEYYFCETPTCKVVYFNNKQGVYLYKEDVKIRIGIKEIENPIPVCYCFGWTQDKIFAQIKQQGFSSAIQEISAKVKAGECACEINNPSGRCCLGEVNKVIKKGLEFYTKGQHKGVVKGKELRNFSVIIGALISAIVASICCVGPVVLAILGIGGAGLFSKFGVFRPFFVILTIAILGLSFYLVYRKKEVVCEDGSCKIKSANKWNKIALWSATILVVLFLFIEPKINTGHNEAYKCNDISCVPRSNLTNREMYDEAIIHVEGMTCADCELNIKNAVRQCDGVINVNADHKKSEVYVEFEKRKTTLGKIIETINKTGYRVTKQ